MQDFFNQNIALLIVLYNPSVEQISKINRLSEAYYCIVVDNSSVVAKGLSSRVLYKPLYKNCGIAYAQNVGLRTAYEKSFKYICFFDQDSVVPNDFPSIMIKHLEFIKNNVDDKIGLLGPTIVNQDTGAEYKSHADRSKLYNKAQFIISSGSVMPIDICCNEKLIDDSLFIDYVDHDLCFKLTHKGYSIYTVRDVILEHKIGKEITHYLGQELVLSQPFRYYFQFRNVLWLSRRRYVPFLWKIKTLLMISSRIPVMLFGDFYKENRVQILKYSLQGVFDGIINNPLHKPF